MIFFEKITLVLIIIVFFLLIPSELLLRFIKSKRKFKNHVTKKLKNINKGKRG